MNKTALLIIDAQVNMFADEMPLYLADYILTNLETLCQKARTTNVPIIFVRHSGDVGDPDEPGTAGWQVHPQLNTQENHAFIDKREPSAFEATPLQEVLSSLGITHLVIAGMQTEVCINATTRQAIELGYDVTLVTDAHSTFDFEDEEKSAAEQIAEHNASLGTLAATKQTNEIEF
ncbi:MAG: cysteine hydrolase family protein [Chloroflexota bacterium]